MCAVAAGLIADREHDRTAIRDTRDLSLQYSQLWRINQIVVRIDGEQRRFDPFEMRRWIIV
jgi:hypothetical protein